MNRGLLRARCEARPARSGNHKAPSRETTNSRWAKAVASANKTPGKANAFSGLTPELSRPAAGEPGKRAEWNCGSFKAKPRSGFGLNDLLGRKLPDLRPR